MDIAKAFGINSFFCKIVYSVSAVAEFSADSRPLCFPDLAPKTPAFESYLFRWCVLKLAPLAFLFCADAAKTFISLRFILNSFLQKMRTIRAAKFQKRKQINALLFLALPVLDGVNLIISTRTTFNRILR